jgi:O-antigen/teichoic acid export membrane protein
MHNIRKFLHTFRLPLAINNGLVNSGASIITSICSILGSIFIVRALSVSDYGQFSYYLWLAGFISTIGTLNFPLTITKVVSELKGAGENKEAKRLIIRISIILFFINFIVTIGLIIFGIFLQQENKSIVWLIALILIPNALLSIFRSSLWGNQKYIFVSASNITASVISLILIIAGYVYYKNFIWFVFSNLLMNLLQFIILGLYLGKSHIKNIAKYFCNFSIKPSTKVVFYGFAIPAAVDMVINLIVYQRSEVFFLERFRDISEVGFYSFSFTIFWLLLGTGWALINGYYPAISHAYGAKNWTNIQLKINQGTLIGLFYAIPVVFGSLSAVKPLINLLYGQKMILAVPISRVLLLGVFPGMIVGMTGLTLSAIGGIWDRVKVGLFVIILHLSLSRLLIPKYGAISAASINLLSQVINAILFYLILKKKFKLSLPISQILKMTLAGLLFTGVIPPLLLYFLGFNS